MHVGQDQPDSPKPGTTHEGEVLIVDLFLIEFVI
jgi:hypothetical protein